MPDFPLVADAQRVQAAGALAASSNGTAVIAAGSANTKGSWVELASATAFESTWALVRILDLSNAIGDYLIDVAIGASGSEQVVLANITASFRSSDVEQMIFLVPLGLPAGSRVAARQQSTALGSSVRIIVELFGGGYAQSSPLSACDTYGANTADSGGVSVDAGATIHTKGAWVEITPATTRPINWLVMGIGNQANGTRTIADWLFDIGIGAGGSEVVLVPDLPVKTGATTNVVGPIHTPMPISIPAGTRIAVRCQSATNDAVDRLLDVILYGVG